MNDDYLSMINYKKYNNRYYFNLNDIKNYLIDDLSIILAKMDYFNIDTTIFNREYIDLYYLLLLITYSNDFRTFKYKFFLIGSSIEKIAEINNPNLCIDRCNSLKYKKGYYNQYKFKSKSTSSFKSFKDIIYEEINNSILLDNYRFII